MKDNKKILQAILIMAELLSYSKTYKTSLIEEIEYLLTIERRKSKEI